MENNTGKETYGGRLVEDLRLDGDTYSALNIQEPGKLIRGNLVADTGGSTISGNFFGISAVGPGARISDNDVDGTCSGTGGAHGIYVDFANTTIIQGKRVAETTSTGSATPTASITTTAARA